MAKDSRPLPQEIEQCLDELERAHIPVIEWLEAGLRWLEVGPVHCRDLRKAERNCARHLTALVDNKTVLGIMEAKLPAFTTSFVEARARIDLVTLRLQEYLRRIRDQPDVKPDTPLYVVHVPIEELPDVLIAYEQAVHDQEQNFTFFNMSADFLDNAYLHAELDAIEDGCEECEGLADALAERVAIWRPDASPEQHVMLSACDSLVRRMRTVQASKRQAIANLRKSTAETDVAVKLKKLTDEDTNDVETSDLRVH